MATLPPKLRFINLKPKGFTCLKCSSFGTTLTELLIALLILGQIATFTIPKILNTQQSQRQNAIFKESYAALAETYIMGRQTGTFFGVLDYSFFTSQVNHIKACPARCDAGCSHASQYLADEPGFVLHNGAVVCGFNKTFNNATHNPDENFSIDWNGLQGSSIVGEDVAVFQFQVSGRIEVSPYTPESNDLYARIFQ